MKPQPAKIMFILGAVGFITALSLLREWMTLQVLGCMTCVLAVGCSLDTKRWIFASVVTVVAALALVAAFYVDGQTIWFAVAGGSLAGAAEVWHSIWRRRKKVYVQTS